ncbi:MAG: TrpB-like pyridoxal phosphate-dependent enzyme [Candidatus Firestonebacteria bacterium]|jgi:tryptophan synthase beta chain|nr:TrpB-like pyridoxal phosphate-dependent enzyme [Candidatus Firestonebacteria bacterium]
MADNKIFLSEKDIPQKWYNVQADMKNKLPPPLKPDGTPAGPEDFAPVFPMEIIKQEMSQERWIEIPDEVREAFKIWRPSPLHRAVNLEKALKTPARIYFKNESVSPAGSHKLNTALPQAYYNKKQGIERLVTETGAGQWGSAIAFATQKFGLECVVYMVKISFEQKPYRRILMQTWGATIYASPTNRTNAGRNVLAKDPKSLGSLGIAISEAVEEAVTGKNSRYCLGSVLNHVCMHQSIIGLETELQLKIAGEKKPDVVIGCVGGGSNFAGIAFPFLSRKMKGEDITLLGVEPSACPTLTRGPFRYDYGDEAKSMPLVKMYTLGHSFVPSGIHAGGLRYHGDSPLLSQFVNEGLIQAVAYPQTPVFDSALLFARTEGILPAPESSHAIKAAIDEAIKCRETKKEKCIVFCLSGHGHFDLGAYEAFLSGKINDVALEECTIKEALADVPVIDWKG